MIESAFSEIANTRNKGAEAKSKSRWGTVIIGVKPTTSLCNIMMSSVVVNQLKNIKQLKEMGLEEEHYSMIGSLVAAGIARDVGMMRKVAHDFLMQSAKVVVKGKDGAKGGPLQSLCGGSDPAQEKDVCHLEDSLLQVLSSMLLNDHKSRETAVSRVANKMKSLCKLKGGKLLPEGVPELVTGLEDDFSGKEKNTEAAQEKIAAFAVDFGIKKVVEKVGGDSQKHIKDLVPLLKAAVQRKEEDVKMELITFKLPPCFM
jgi:hypothetical protein